MGRKGSSGATGVSRSSGFTWLGLAITAVGWALLLAGLLVSDAALKAGSLVATMAARSDIVTIAQAAILSGLGLAIIGALRSGFGAFGRFFDAVLQRSTAPRPAAPVEPAPLATVTPIERGTAPPQPPPPLRTKDRNYVILADGSVEVETMFGTRVFATIDEAREFIRER